MPLEASDTYRHRLLNGNLRRTELRRMFPATKLMIRISGVCNRSWLHGFITESSSTRLIGRIGKMMTIGIALRISRDALSYSKSTTTPTQKCRDRLSDLESGSELAKTAERLLMIAMTTSRKRSPSRFRIEGHTVIFRSECQCSIVTYIASYYYSLK